MILVSFCKKSRSLVDEQKEALLSDHKVVYIDGRPENANSIQHQDSIRGIVENFFYDQFQSFADPVAPYFPAIATIIT
ncbi:MAG: hypothetical protein K2K93_10275 [Muribaculaceae bacterium]|nr:hypothetical protein [Muribaculaceae bacterium]